jgi:hypothetical protein
VSIHKGRKLTVLGEPYTWRLSDKGGRIDGTSGKEATFTAQHSGAHGALLRVRLFSTKWTERHETDDYLQETHRCAFTPGDARTLIEAAIESGWKPKEKGSEHHGAPLVDLGDYTTLPTRQHRGTGGP